MSVAPKKVQKGTRQWPQVIPAKSNRGFGTCGRTKKQNFLTCCSLHEHPGYVHITLCLWLLKEEELLCERVRKDNITAILMGSGDCKGCSRENNLRKRQAFSRNSPGVQLITKTRKDTTNRLCNA